MGTLCLSSPAMIPTGALNSGSAFGLSELGQRLLRDARSDGQCSPPSHAAMEQWVRNRLEVEIDVYRLIWGEHDGRDRGHARHIGEAHLWNSKAETDVRI